MHTYILTHIHTHAHLQTYVSVFFFFDVLLTVHLNIFISVINQLDAQNFVLFYFMSVHVSSTCAHHQDLTCVMIPEAL